MSLPDSVLSVFDQAFNHAIVGESGYVPQVGIIVGRDLAQNPAHDFSGASFWQSVCELHEVGAGDGTNDLTHLRDEFGSELVRRLYRGIQRHITINSLSLDVVRKSNNGRFRDSGVCHKCTLDFGRTHPVPGNIDDIVHPAGDPVISVFVPSASIARKIFPLKRREVRAHESFVVPINGASLARPRVRQHQYTLTSPLQQVSLEIQDLGSNAEELVRRILSQGYGFVDTRKIWGILSLDKSYPAAMIDEACRKALAMDSPSFRTVKGILEIGPKPPAGSLSKRTEGYRFVRPLSVYSDQLLMFEKEEGTA